DEAEQARALDEFLQQVQRWETVCASTKGLKPAEPQPPDMSGGFGFDPKRAPDANCPHCFGKGQLDVLLHDSTKLSPAARKLFKGAEKDRYGAIKVHLHDQAAARDRLYRALGAYKDGAQVPAVELPEQKAPISATAGDSEAAQEYLRMMGR